MFLLFQLAIQQNRDERDTPVLQWACVRKHCLACCSESQIEMYTRHWHAPATSTLNQSPAAPERPAPRPFLPLSTAWDTFDQSCNISNINQDLPGNPNEKWSIPRWPNHILPKTSGPHPTNQMLKINFPPLTPKPTPNIFSGNKGKKYTYTVVSPSVHEGKRAWLIHLSFKLLIVGVLIMSNYYD